jgi:hypothetical protein
MSSSIKKFGTLLFLLFWAFMSQSQTYEPLPDSGARWVNVLKKLNSNSPPRLCKFERSETFCSDGSDTIIDSKTYFRINKCSYEYKGAMRNDSGRVFFVPRDSTSEFLLYDFTASEGDTIKNVLVDQGGYYTLYDPVVWQTDTVQVNGTPRKKLSVDNGTWIEGIGNTRGLFWRTWEGPFCFELYCMSKGDTIMYPYFQTDTSCALNVGVKRNTKKENGKKIDVHPNPLKSGPLKVETPAHIGKVRYELYNPKGKLLREKSLEGARIDIPEQKGIYFIKFLKEEGSSVHKLILR